MSQHIFPVSEGVECMVGWDPPLCTFFGQVYKVDEEGERIDDEDEGGGMIFRVGASFREVVTVDHLAKCLRPYVERIPDEIYHEMYLVEID